MSRAIENSANSTTTILWRQVWGLAALHAAINLSWMVYNFYQPKILIQYNLIELASKLWIFQGVLGTFIDPLMGGLADRIKQWTGSGFPLITFGVTLAGLIFISVSLLAQSNPPPTMYWLMPVLMMVWVAAMKIFQSPAISLLGRYAPPQELPEANAILTLVGGLIGAINPLFERLIAQLGAAFTFILAGILLVVAATILRDLERSRSAAEALYQAELATPAEIKVTPPPEPIYPKLAIFALGLIAGWQVILMFVVFPSFLQSKILISQLDASIITAIILFISGVSAIPLGKLAVKFGNHQVFLGGLGLMPGVMALTLISPSNWLVVGLLIGFGLSMSAIFNGGIPWALSMVSPQKFGLGIGLYFGGFSAATAICAMLTTQLAATGGITPILGAFGAAIAFFLAIPLMASSQPR